MESYAAQHPGELPVKAGEILNVVRQDIGEGWWEAKNSSGKCGLIPQSYLEPIPTTNMDPNPPTMPPPPLPSIYSNLAEMFSTLQTSVPFPPSAPPAGTSNINFDPYAPPSKSLNVPELPSWGPPYNNVKQLQIPSTTITPNAPPYSFSTGDTAVPTQNQHYSLQHDWDSDWDDDEYEDEVYAQPNLVTSDSNQAVQNGAASNIPLPTKANLRRSQSELGGSVGTLKRNLNKFSLFKSGVEPYIMGQSKTRDSDEIPGLGSPYSIEIIQTPNHGVSYRPLTVDKIYSCIISSPQKETKLKGLKSFIAYQLTCSNSGIKISRRYKHFDWLHERLEEKFTLIAIPPLPGKQVTGRYQEEFIEHRMNQLQMWINRICRHPILSQCQVWQHFVTCTDMKYWKEGKRRAEKDPFIGPELFNTIKIPNQSFDSEQVESQLLKFTKFIKKLDYTVAVLSNHLSDLSKKVLSPSAGYFDFLLVQFNNIAKAFEMDERNDIDQMVLGIQSMCESSHINWEIFYNKYKNNLMLIHDMLYEYRGFLSEFPQILNNYRSALNRVKEHQKTFETNNNSTTNHANIPECEKIGVVFKRMDVITYHTLAEINYFRGECAKDFRVIIKLVLQTLLDYFNQIIQHITKAISIFDSLK